MTLLQIKWSEKNGWGTPLICQLRNFDMHPAAKVCVKKYKRQINHSSPRRLAGEKKIIGLIIKQQFGFSIRTS